MFILIILLVLVLVFLFLIAPSRESGRFSQFLGRTYAHRGLYRENQSITENTLEAFDKAAGLGYGIELDIRFTKDKKIVVFHDNTLKRFAGKDVRIDEMEYEELAGISLPGHSHIPLFTEVLDCVRGRVPLIVEIKNGRNDPELCASALAILQKYDGPFCIESFDPRIVRWFKKNAPDICRGQLACSVSTADKGTPRIVAFAASRCMLNFLSRPHFIAYELTKKPFSVKLCEKLGAIPVCWTSHALSDHGKNKMVIFEYYYPETHF